MRSYSRWNLGPLSIWKRALTCPARTEPSWSCSHGYVSQKCVKMQKKSIKTLQQFGKNCRKNQPISCWLFFFWLICWWPVLYPRFWRLHRYLFVCTAALRSVSAACKHLILPTNSLRPWFYIHPLCYTDRNWTGVREHINLTTSLKSFILLSTESGVCQRF